MFSDTPDGATANDLYLTIVEQAKAYGLNLYEYLKYLPEHRPSKDMPDEELSKFVPRNETVRELCKNKAEEKHLPPRIPAMELRDKLWSTPRN